MKHKHPFAATTRQAVLVRLCMLLMALLIAVLLQAPLPASAVAQSLGISVSHGDGTALDLNTPRTLASFETGIVQVNFTQASAPTTLTVELPYFYNFADTVTVGPHSGYTIDSISADGRTLQMTVPDTGGQAAAFSFNIALDRMSVTDTEQSAWRQGTWDPNTSVSKLFSVTDQVITESVSFPTIITTDYAGITAGWYKSQFGGPAFNQFSPDSYETTQLVSEHGDRVMFGGDNGAAELVVTYPWVDIYEVGPLLIFNIGVVHPSAYKLEGPPLNRFRNFDTPVPNDWNVNPGGFFWNPPSPYIAFSVDPTKANQKPGALQVWGLLRYYPIQQYRSNTQASGTLLTAGSEHDFTLKVNVAQGYKPIGDTTVTLKVIDYTLQDNTAIANPGVPMAPDNTKIILQQAKAGSNDNVTGMPAGIIYPPDVTRMRFGRQPGATAGTYTAPESDGSGAVFKLEFDPGVQVKGINLLVKRSALPEDGDLYHNEVQATSITYTYTNGTSGTVNAADFVDEYYRLEPVDRPAGHYIKDITVNYGKLAYVTEGEDISRILARGMSYNIAEDAPEDATYPINGFLTMGDDTYTATSYILVRSLEDPAFTALGGQGNWTNNGQRYADNGNNGPFDDISLLSQYVGPVKYADGTQVYVDDEGKAANASGTPYTEDDPGVTPLHSDVLDKLEKPRFDFPLTNAASGYYTNGKIHMSQAMATGAWEVRVAVQTAAGLAAGTANVTKTFTIPKPTGGAAFVYDLYQNGLGPDEVIQYLVLESQDTIDISSLSNAYGQNVRKPLVELGFDSLRQNPLTGLYTGGGFNSPHTGEAGFQWTLNNGAKLQYQNCQCIDGRHLSMTHAANQNLRPGAIFMKGAELLIPTAINTQWTGSFLQGEVTSLTADIALQAQAYGVENKLFSQDGQVFYLKLADQPYVQFVPGTAQVDGVADPDAQVVTLNGATYLKVTNRQPSSVEKTAIGTGTKDFAPWRITFDVFTLASTPSSSMLTFAEDTGNWLDLGQTNPYTHGEGRFVSIQPNVLGGAQTASWSLVTNNPNIQDDPLKLYNEASVLNHRWALPFKGFAMVPNLSDRHGVTLNPGLNYVYQSEYQAVRPHQQGELTTYVSVSAPASIEVKGLSSTIALPRAGDALGSEVSLFLRGPLETDIAPTQPGTTAPDVSYSTDGVTFAPATAGTDWAAVTHVRLLIDTVMPGDAMGLVMPLRTEAWGEEDDILRSGDLGKALMQASFLAESGFLAEQFDRMNTYEFLPNAISGYVWEDANTDGFWQDSETRLADITVHLYEFANGADKRLVLSTTTIADGSYHFDTAAFQNLQVEIALPTGYTTVPITQPSPGNVFVSNDDLLTAFTVSGTFAPLHELETLTDVNAGLVQFIPAESLENHLLGQKLLEGGTLEDGQFTFTLTAHSENPPGATINTAEAANTGDVIDFGPGALTFTLPGTFVFEVAETMGTLPGVTYDADPVQVTFQVVLASDGMSLEIAEVTYEKNQTALEGLLFENQQAYPLPLQLQGIKRFIGKGAVLKAGQFTFSLTGYGEPQTAINDLEGNFTFPDREVLKPGIINLVLTEVKGNDPNVRYDDTRYDIRMNYLATPNAPGSFLEVTILKNGEPVTNLTPEFVNEYSAPTEPTETDPPTYPTLRVPISASKVLKGGVLKAGQFTFELRDGAGKVIATASNDENGLVTFPDRTFSRTGTFVYTIREVAGTQAQMTYDTAVWKVRITTTPNGNVLQAAVDYLKNDVPTASAPEFTNTLKLPSTGDSTPMMAFSLFLAGIVSLGLALLIGWRRKLKQ